MSESASTPDESPTTTATVEEAATPEADEYAHLRTKRAEREGNVETAVVEDVFVGSDRVTLSVSFEWTDEVYRIRYDVDDDRDVLCLEAVAESRGFDFEQVGHLENARIEVAYTGREWVPTAHPEIVEGRGSMAETFRTELRLLGRELARTPGLLRGGIRGVRSLSSKQAIVAVVLVKKVAIVALLAYLLL
jgi:hypothetical protein